jgi:outer membrane immunogenic protein
MAALSFFGVGANGFGYCLAADQKLTNFGTARARGGILINENLLWYFTGGLAWGTVKDNLTFAGSANQTVFPPSLQPGAFLGGSAGFSTTKVGWTLGAGVETKLGGGWSAKLEYLFVDLGSVTNTVPIAINPAFGPAFTTGGGATATSTAHVMDNIVRVGLNYTFGQNAAAGGAASNMPTKAPILKTAAASTADWTGFYIGLNTGGSVGTGSASQDAVFSSTALGTNGLLSSSNRYSPYGWVVGGQLGYNKQISNWVVGVEADWQWTSQKAGSNACAPPATIAFFGAGADGFGYCLAADQKLTNFGTARARGGILTNENLLWYLTGGLAWGTVKENLTFAGSANPTIFTGALQPGPFLGGSVGFSTTKVGWTLGAGVETKLGGGWSAKLEYLFVDLGSVTDTMAIAINPAFGPAFNKRRDRHKYCARYGQHRTRGPQLHIQMRPQGIMSAIGTKRTLACALHTSTFDPKRTGRARPLVALLPRSIVCLVCAIPSRRIL